MQSQKNIQILVETMTRCAGNCSGCALSSFERMNTSFDFDNFANKTQMIAELLLPVNPDEIESVTIFLGQGDHFLMEHQDIDRFVEYCSQMVPEHLKAKTMVFITASAIGKSQVIAEKMQQFYQSSIKYRIPFFIQVVFDPKKMMVNDKFKDIYLKNILGFKNTFGMTEVTINMGNDLFETMSAKEFHEWVKEYGFKHIEMNWVLNQHTHKMWQTSSEKMFAWLEDWLLLYKQEPVYEINFIPFLGRAFLHKTQPIMQLKDKISEDLRNNLYIDYDGNIMFSQMGIISNLTPFGERLQHQKYALEDIDDKSREQSRKIMNRILRHPTCGSCEFKNICATSGSVAWFDYPDNVDNHNQEDDICPWNIKSFLQFYEKEFVQQTNKDYFKTAFDKNPVQSSHLKVHNNEIYDYFEEKFI